jgi:1-aminocyclopropane-1-carboxylate deaminase
VIGIDASKTFRQEMDQVQRELRDDEITVVDGYAGPAYGTPDDPTIEAIHLAARTEST